MEINIKEIQKKIPEMPWQKRERFYKEFQLSTKEIEILIRNKGLSDYFEKVVSELKNWLKIEKVSENKFPSVIKAAVNYLESDLLGLLKQKAIKGKQSEDFVRDLKITPENFAELITILWKGEISSRAGKDVLLQMFESGADPSHIIQDKDLTQVSDKGKIEKITKEIIDVNQRAVSDYKKGKKNAIQFLVGQVMRETKGKINPKEAEHSIKKILNS